MKAKNNATGYYVIYKENGLICSFQRKPDGSMRDHDHYKTALNAMKRFGGNNGWDSGWFVVTTVALARCKWAV